MKEINRSGLSGLVILLLLLMFCSGIPARAQKSWSLQDCISHALDNNLQIKQQRLGLEAESGNLLQSRAAMLPSVNGQLSHGYNYGKAVDRFTNTFATQSVQFDNFYAQGQLTLFNGFVLLNTVARNKLNVQASMYDVEKMQNDISLNLASAYLNILFNREYLAVAGDQLDITRQQVSRISRLVEAGSLAKSNLLSIEAQAANEELQLVTAENNLELSYLTLTQILDLKSREGFDIQRPDIKVPDQMPLLERPEQIFSVAQGVQPQIKSAELRLKSSEKDLSIARGNLSPVITMAGSYGTGYSGAKQPLSYEPSGLDTIGWLAQDPASYVVMPAFTTTYGTIPFSDQINDNINQSLGFYLNIPLFNGLQTRTAISRAKIGVESARLTLETARNQLYQDIQRAYADASAAVKRYHASKKAVEAMKEAYFYTEQKFAVGMANPVEYNEAKKNLSKSESDLLTAKYEYVFKKTVLDFYMGKPLEIK